MVKKHVVICGLLRQHPNFFKSLDVYSSLRKKNLIDSIIISTWDDQVKLPILKEISRRYDVEIRNCPLPIKLKSFGNVLYQAKSMDLGTEHLDPNDWVLRTRTEYMFSESFLFNLLKKEYMFDKPAGSGNIFDKKIWINWAEMTKPFYIEDSVMYGQVKDIRCLISYDQIQSDPTWLKNVGQGRSHIRRFVHPFLHVSEIEKFIKTKDVIPFHKNNRHPSILKMLINDGEYIKLMAMYYKILYNYFLIYTEPKMSKFKHVYSNPLNNLNNNIFTGNFCSQNQIMDKFIMCYDCRLLNNLMRGYINESEAIKLYELSRGVNI